MKNITIPLSISLGILAAGTIIAAQNREKSAPARIAQASQHSQAASVGKPDASAASYPILPARLSSVSPDLFSPPAPPTPQREPAPPPPVARTQRALPRFLPPDPLTDFVYSGSVTLGGKRYALVENSKTKEGKYVKAGDTLLGEKVRQVGPEQLVLRQGSKTRTLAKSETINLTPLNQSAAYLNPGPSAQPATAQSNPNAALQAMLAAQAQQQAAQAQQQVERQQARAAMQAARAQWNYQRMMMRQAGQGTPGNGMSPPFSRSLQGMQR